MLYIDEALNKIISKLPDKSKKAELNKKLLREELASGALAVEKHKAFGGDDG